MMLRVSRQTVRRNWALYAGSFVALFLGVGLIGLSVEMIAAVSNYQSHLGPGDEATRVKLDDLTSMLGVMAGFSGFMAIFVVASTFSFVVSSRRRELGLLRLIGSTPRQVRRMVLGEALFVATTSSLAGCVFAWLITPLALRVVEWKHLTPVPLDAPSPWLALAIAFPIGVVVALIGAWIAARRASRIPPIDALRESSVERRRPGFWRLLIGTVCLGGAVAMLTLLRATSGELALLMGIFGPELIVIAIVCFGQVVIPATARLVALPLMAVNKDISIRLARDNVVASARRTASLAAPILAISAIAGSLILTLSIAADWDRALTTQRLKARLVVESNGDTSAAPVLKRSAVVGAVDSAMKIDVTMIMAPDDQDVQDVEGIAVGSATAARSAHAYRGSLANLHGNTFAVTRTYAFDSGFHFGRTTTMKFPDGTKSKMRLVAFVDDAPSLYSEVLVDADFARSHAPHAAADRWFVQPAPGVSPARAVATLNRELRHTEARAQLSPAWIAANDADQRKSNSLGLWVVLGPAGLYSALAIANTLLMGSLQRHREFVATRLIGATTRQVRRMVLWESALVAIAALTLGAITTATVGFLVRNALIREVPDMTVTIPWTSLTLIALISMVIAAAAAAAPTSILLRHVHPSQASE